MPRQKKRGSTKGSKSAKPTDDPPKNLSSQSKQVKEPVKDVSTKDVSAKDVSAKDVSAKDVSAKDVSAKDVSTKDVSTKDASDKLVSAKDVSVQSNGSENTKTLSSSDDEDERVGERPATPKGSDEKTMLSSSSSDDDDELSETEKRERARERVGTPKSSDSDSISSESSADDDSETSAEEGEDPDERAERQAQKRPDPELRKRMKEWDKQVEAILTIKPPSDSDSDTDETDTTADKTDTTGNKAKDKTGTTMDMTKDKTTKTTTNKTGMGTPKGSSSASSSSESEEDDEEGDDVDEDDDDDDDDDVEEERETKEDSDLTLIVNEKGEKGKKRSMGSTGGPPTKRAKKSDQKKAGGSTAKQKAKIIVEKQKTAKRRLTGLTKVGPRPPYMSGKRDCPTPLLVSESRRAILLNLYDHFQVRGYKVKDVTLDTIRNYDLDPRLYLFPESEDVLLDEKEAARRKEARKTYPFHPFPFQTKSELKQHPLCRAAEFRCRVNWVVEDPVRHRIIDVYLLSVLGVPVLDRICVPAGHYAILIVDYLMTPSMEKRSLDEWHIRPTGPTEHWQKWMAKSQADASASATATAAAANASAPVPPSTSAVAAAAMTTKPNSATSTVLVPDEQPKMTAAEEKSASSTSKPPAMGGPVSAALARVRRINLEVMSSWMFLCDYSKHNKYYVPMYMQLMSPKEIQRLKEIEPDPTRLPFMSTHDARRHYDFGPWVDTDMVSIARMTPNGGICPYYRRIL